MSDESTTNLDKFQSNLNSKRTLFNVIVYIVLPASLVLSFLYSLLLTRENKIDYLLFITFVTMSYSIVVFLIELLKTDENMIGLKYVINKLGIDDDFNTDIEITMDNKKNVCDLSFNYPDRDNINAGFSDINPKTSKIIEGDKKTDENSISDKTNKEFYNRCDGLVNSDNLFKVKGTCLGQDNESMGKCANIIKDAKDSNEAYELCNNYYSSNTSTIVIIFTVFCVIFADGVQLLTGNSLYSGFIRALGWTVFGVYSFVSYLNTPPCDYVDMNYPNIAVSPFPHYFLYAIILSAAVKSLSTIFKIYYLGVPEYTWLIIYLTILSSTYIIMDYSFINVLESSYSGLGKFVNVTKLDRKYDNMNYNMNFVEKSTNKRCSIDGIWDKRNNPPNIKGDLEGCNPDILGKYL